MQKQIKIFFIFFTILILATSCAKKNPNNPIVVNDWQNNKNHSLLKKNWYDISDINIKYNYDGIIFTSSYQETIKYTLQVEEIVWNSDNTSGIIYGKYTDNKDYPNLVGKYYAIAFKDLTFESVSISEASKTDTISATDTLDKAKTTFTEANGYFSKYSSCKIYSEAVGTVHYGSKSYTGEITQEKIEELWKSMIANQTVYSTSSYTTISGEFKSDANYYETKWQEGNSPRTEFKRCIVYNYNEKNYIAGIYWDNQTGIGMQIRYRLIIIDENGVEQAWYGGGSDANIIPDENTSDWVKYYFVFGYLKNY